jgi:prolipoprotein diacylglyceryltransferase
MHEVIAVLILLVFLAAFAFWIWMLVECITKEPDAGNNKLIWIIVIVFTQIIGAVIYYVIRRPQRLAEVGQ